MRSVIVAALTLGLLGTGGVALADPNLPDIRPHRHFVQTPEGALIQVGPRVCDDPRQQQAFNQFHSNVHHAVPDSPGPETSAKGLHNGYGSDLTAQRC